LSRVAVIQEGADETVARDFRNLEDAAQVLDLHLQRLDIRDPSSLDAAFEAATRERAEGLLLGGSRFFVDVRRRIVAPAAQHHLQPMYYTAPFVGAGGLMSYSSTPVEQYRRAAYYVDRLLKGAKPADLPVEQPMTFAFVVNLKTARELGITFPNEILL